LTYLKTSTTVQDSGGHGAQYEASRPSLTSASWFRK